MPRGQMRHTVRPFKIEFKSRSSRSTSMRSPMGGDSGKDAATPASEGPGDLWADRLNHTAAPDAVMQAAHAIFGRASSPAPAPQAISTSSAPVGRVLPSLIENASALEVRPAESEQKKSRGRAGRKAKSASPVKPRKSPAPAERAVTPAPPQPPKMKVAPQTPSATPDLERRSARKRRLLDVELKAGEKWKRRLCMAAR
jgi:hypothetical protein